MSGSGEKYLISKAKKAQINDPHSALSWILTAKTLYPNDFGVQFEAYEIEKKAENFEEAAKCFTYIVLTFQNQSIAIDELWHEIKKLTEALRASTLNSEQEFYVKMFKYIGVEVQQKILLLTANNNSDNSLDHCRLILLLLKRFPQAIPTHAFRLLETLIQGMATSAKQFREILVLEALPLIFQKPPENLSTGLVNRVMAICFEYYINQMMEDGEDKRHIHENWKNIFEILDLCGKILKWQPFLKYNKNWSKDIYWQKLIEIVSSASPRPSENKQILFLATTLFVLSLQQYIKATNLQCTHNNESDSCLLLVELKDPPILPSTKRRKIDPHKDPEIFVHPGNPETSSCLKTAAKCWQILHSNEILQIDFSNLIMHIPITKWISRFLLDLSIYLGRNDEANTLMESDSLEMTMLEKNLRQLGLTMNQPSFNVQIYEYILPILQNLPNQMGIYIPNIPNVATISRQLILLPLTKKAILQFCVKIIINSLKQKITIHPNCNDNVLGNLLVLLQLNWNEESALAEKVFDMIRTRKSFTYLSFPNYIINIDMIEEFMHISGEIKLEFATQGTVGQPRRISTRGQNCCGKEDSKLIIRQQISKSNDNIEQLIVQFIQQEHLKLINCIVETTDLST